MFKIKNIWQKIQDWYYNHRWIGYLAVFLIALIYFVALQWTPVFADPDAFYHSKMAIMIRDQGLIKNFIWLPFTVLGNYYIDQHFLYHVFLILFVSLFNPLWGVKLATIILAALLALVFYWFLKTSRIKWPGAWTALLLVSEPLIFRINLVKANSASLIFILLIVYALIHRRYLAVFFLNFFYVWLYGGWPIIIPTLFFYLLADFFAGEGGVRERLKRLFNKHNWFSLGAVFGGLIVGVVVNPYFTQNLNFYWQQFVQIGVINYGAAIGVGAEWYPYKPLELLTASSPLAAVFIPLVLLFFIFIKKQNRLSWKFLFLSLFFLAITFKSRRYVEYFIPAAVLFAAFSYNAVFGRFRLRDWRREFFSGWQRWALGAVWSILLVFLLIIIGFQSINLREGLRRGYSFTGFKNASEWLADHTGKGEVIFHSDWDDFPALFYFNSRDVYISGLDPTFLYKEDAKKLEDYAAITRGNYIGDAVKTIREEFQSRYVLIGKDHPQMKKLFDDRPEADLIYDDKDVWIYKLTDRL